MSNRLFTVEQQEELRKNKYTRRVSPRSLKFTDEFIQEVKKGLLEGKDIREIIVELEYDPEVIGDRRIKYILNSVSERNGLKHSKKKRPPADTKYSEMKTDDAIKAMETELTYLRQEVEFLKKISQLDKDKEQSN